jgi:hypothetical protein
MEIKNIERIIGKGWIRIRYNIGMIIYSVINNTIDLYWFVYNNNHLVNQA